MCMYAVSARAALAYVAQGDASRAYRGSAAQVTAHDTFRALLSRLH